MSARRNKSKLDLETLCSWCLLYIIAGNLIGDIVFLHDWNFYRCPPHTIGRWIVYAADCPNNAPIMAKVAWDIVVTIPRLAILSVGMSIYFLFMTVVEPKWLMFEIALLFLSLPTAVIGIFGIAYWRKQSPFALLPLVAAILTIVVWEVFRTNLVR